MELKKIEIITENEAVVDENGVFVKLCNGKVFLSYNEAPVCAVKITWENTYFSDARIMGDAWERGYGDLQWKGIDESRIMPWYFLAYDGSKTYAFGVKTQPNSLCYWSCSKDNITLTMLVQNGNRGVQLGSRKLEVCTVVTAEYTETVISAAASFCKHMCDSPRLPQRPVFGGNDWYCNYGDNSHDKIIKHTKRIAECSKECPYPPFMVIDDGWQICHHPSDDLESDEYFNGGPWSVCNSNFKGMKELADAIKEEGAIPGIWFRPLWTVEKFPEEMILKYKGIKYTLDPSVPAVLNQIKKDVAQIREWGYKLIKFDFASFDIFGKWGFEMDEAVADCEFHDKTKTTAEIIKDFYKAIKEAAGDDVLLIGCNTISHLAAEIVEIQRTGDDTSGIDWERTKKYGMNTLAFRMCQHKAFYFVDADCVGITNLIEWNRNKQWLDVLAKSGTPLFVSIADDAYTDEIRNDLTAAFKMASSDVAVSEPLDWMETKRPSRWKSAFGTDEYNW